MYVDPTTHLRHRTEATERLLTEFQRRTAFRSRGTARSVLLWDRVRHRIDVRREAARFLRGISDADPRVRADLISVAHRQG